jgi:chemotaxis signal transduction protein
VAGIMNYAGYSLPVIDLAIRLGMISRPYTLDTPIIVCRHEQQRIAVIVQDIIGVQTLNGPELQLGAQFARYDTAVRASAHTAQGLALLLDVAWLMQPELYQFMQDEDC